MCNHSKPASGFTLLELIVTISIAGVLMALAVPSFSDLIRNNRLTTYANELVTSLNTARSEAVKRGQHVVVRKTGTDWENGWQIFVDVDRPKDTVKENAFNDDGDTTLCETGEDCLLRVYAALPSPYTLRGNQNFINFIRYQPDGTSNQMGSFAICAKATPEPYASRLIIVNSVGRIRVGVDKYNSSKTLVSDGIPETDDGDKKSNLTSCIAPF